MVKNYQENKDKSSVFAVGSRTINQQIAPASIIISEDEIKMENNYVRSFVLNGYPSRVEIGWLDHLYSYNGDMDISVHIEPANERTALEELIDKITQYESQYMIELEKGSIKNTSDLANKIKILSEQREKIEQNYESLFHVSTFCTLFNTDLKELNKESQRMQSRLAGRKIGMMPLSLRQDDGLMSSSPYGILTIPEYCRNMNTGALSTMFPFYNPSIVEQDGTFLGINKYGTTPIFINLFNTKELGNANLAIFGMSGAGKTFFTCLIIGRSIPEGIKHCIIDPENEFGVLCDIYGGISIRIAPNSQYMINPFDIDEEVEIDIKGNLTGRRFVDIKGKCSELLNLLGIMLPNYMDEATRAEISDILVNLYYSYGFTEDVSSLYENENSFDELSGTFVRGKVLRTMPTMSDFRHFLSERAEERNSQKLREIVGALGIYCKGGIYDIFDGYSTVDMSNYENVPIIRFDVSAIEDEVLRPIGMQVALSWAWNKFIKKDGKTKKRLVCDEEWMLLSQAMAGSEYTAHCLENFARRIRKYNGSLCSVSQNFREFVGRPEGQSILSNSAIRIFFRQQPEDIEAVGDRFIMSDGEKEFLLSALRGDMLIKKGSENIVGRVFAFPFEEELFGKDK